jgi:DNA (cytosine-5)-methyltransferase 1
MGQRIRYLDLFAGAGGWSCGLEDLGWYHAAMYDHNASACRTARANFGDIVHEVDLRKHKRLQFPNVDVVVGSPPCQGFSNEGYKKKEDPRNSLVWDFFDIVERISPKLWVFENVPGLKRLHKGEIYHLMKKRMARMDYHCMDFFLEASNFGVPQTRDRFFIVGSKKMPFRAPQGEYDETMFGLPKRSLWEAISDLPRVPHGERKGLFRYDRRASCEYQKLMRKHSKLVVNHTTQKHSERVLEKISRIPVGGDMSKLVGLYTENQVHYCGGYRRAEKALPSWTAYWTRGMTSIHPEQDRFLSPRECARIQSFPDRFVFHGTTIENYTQICNAVPPLLAQAIGREIENHLSGERYKSKKPRPARKTETQSIALA